MEAVVSAEAVFQGSILSQLVRDIHANASRSRGQLNRLALAQRNAVVKLVNAHLQNPQVACTNDTIFAVVTLAFNSTTCRTLVSGAHSRPNQGPLKELRCLDLYGGPIEQVSVHQQGLKTLIELRGGLSNIDIPGLPEMMS